MFYKLRDWIDINKIDWEYLSFNSNAIELLKENQNKISWIYLSRNPNAIELLKENSNKINISKYIKNIDYKKIDIYSLGITIIEIIYTLSIHNTLKIKNKAKYNKFIKLCT